jgi:hypothetical protein
MAKEKRQVEDVTAEPSTKAVARVRTNPLPTGVREVQTWLRECLFLITEDDDCARFTRVAAHVLTQGGAKRGEHVFAVDVPKKAGEDWCDTAGLEIYGKLQTETANLGGLRKYALYAYHTGDNEAHTSRFVVRIQGNDEDEEPGTSEGALKGDIHLQAMKHAEAYAKIMAGMVTGLMGSYQSQVARQSTMIEKLMEDKLGGIEAMQALLDQKEERDINLMQAKVKADGMKNLIGRLGLLLPAVANRVAGKPIFPVEDTAMMMMVKSLFTSLAASPEKLERLMATLGPEESVAFMNIYEQLSSKDENGLTVKPDKESE